PRGPRPNPPWPGCGPGRPFFRRWRIVATPARILLAASDPCVVSPVPPPSLLGWSSLTPHCQSMTSVLGSRKQPRKTPSQGAAQPPARCGRKSDGTLRLTRTVHAPEPECSTPESTTATASVIDR